MTLFSSRVTRTKASGIDLIVCPTEISGVVTLVGSLPAGEAHAGVNNGAVPVLTAALLDKGAAGRSKSAIAQKLEEVGASLSFGAGAQTLEIRGKCLRRDLRRVVGLLADQLRRPGFPAEELEKVKTQYVTGVRARVEDADAQAADAFGRAVYPAGHPNRHLPAAECENAAREATLDEVKSFHAGIYGPAFMTLAAVGDVKPAEVEAVVAKSFEGWTGGVPAVKPPPGAGAPQPVDERIFLADKPSAAAVLGQQSGAAFADRDYPALQLATAILGSGFTGRLMNQVRVKEGLTYGIAAWMGNDLFTPGDWRIWGNFTPALLDRGIASARKVFEEWHASGVTAGELETRKRNFLGQFQLGLSTTGGIAERLVRTVQAGLDMPWLDGYADRIRAISLDEVNRAIRAHLDPARMTVIRAGTIY